MRAPESPDDALVAVLKVDPYDRVASSRGVHVAAALAETYLAGLIGPLGDDVSVEALSPMKFVLRAGASGERVADKLTNVVLSGAQIVTEGEDRYFVDAKLGVAFARGHPSTLDPAELLRYAHLALSSALADGEVVIVADARFVATTIDEFERQRRLVDADPADFSLRYQPIVDLSDLHVVGHESLMRWDSVDAPTCGPAVFLPMVERTALLRPITRSILRTAIADLMQGAIADGDTSAFVSLNYSENQLMSVEVVDALVDAIKAADLGPGRVWIEVREDQVINLQSGAARAIERLKDAGCTICIDDLGAGYSALSYVRDLPVDVLKVDIALIDKLRTDNTAVAITHAICDLARATGLKTVAEGVERAELLPVLRELGFDYGQGFYFGRPRPPATSRT